MFLKLTFVFWSRVLKQTNFTQPQHAAEQSKLFFICLTVEKLMFFVLKNHLSVDSKLQARV